MTTFGVNARSTATLSPHLFNRMLANDGATTLCQLPGWSLSLRLKRGPTRPSGQPRPVRWFELSLKREITLWEDQLSPSVNIAVKTASGVLLETTLDPASETLNPRYWRLFTPRSIPQHDVCIELTAGITEQVQKTLDTLSPNKSTDGATSSSLLSATLRNVLEGKSASDTRFTLYTQRRAVVSGKTSKPYYQVSSPMALFADSELLASVSEYFQNLLLGSFAEASDRSTLEEIPEYITDYDYWSDSDLETDPPFADHELPAERSDTHANDTEKPQSKIEPSDNKVAVQSGLVTSTATKNVHIKDTAYRTWRALLYYLYTSEISFSQINSGDRGSLERFAVSPKSMYRLADKLGLDGLASLALGNLRTQINNENVVEEIFSNFTSRYPVVRTMELDVLLASWNIVKKRASFDNKLREVARGERPYAQDVLPELLDRLYYIGEDSDITLLPDE